MEITLENHTPDRDITVFTMDSPFFSIFNHINTVLLSYDSEVASSKYKAKDLIKFIDLQIEYYKFLDIEMIETQKFEDYSDIYPGLLRLKKALMRYPESYINIIK